MLVSRNQRSRGFVEHPCVYCLRDCVRHVAPDRHKRECWSVRPTDAAEPRRAGRSSAGPAERRMDPVLRASDQVLRCATVYRVQEPSPGAGFDKAVSFLIGERELEEDA